MPEEQGGMTFFTKTADEMAPLTDEEKKKIAAVKKEGMDHEGRGLPIQYPKIGMLQQGTAQFEFVNTKKVMETFNAIIVYLDASRAYWKKAFGTEGSGGFPDCFSRDLIYPDPQV